jgi:hypothetical protein
MYGIYLIPTIGLSFGFFPSSAFITSQLKNSFGQNVHFPALFFLVMLLHSLSYLFFLFFSFICFANSA